MTAALRERVLVDDRGNDEGGRRGDGIVPRRLLVASSSAALACLLLLLGASSGRATPSPPYYGPAVLATHNLAGYWPLDETGGTTAGDQVSSPANGTYHGGVTLGGVGAIQTSTDLAPTFNGSTGYVSTASVSKLQPTASASLEVWFKTSSASLQKMMSAGQGSGLELSLSNGSLRGIVNGVGVVSARSSYNDGAWHYAVLTWDGSRVSLYADGALAVPASTSSNPCAQASAPSYGSTGVYIGVSYGLGGYFNGSLDEAALYGANSGSSGALSAGEIANHYAAGTSGPVETPIDVVVPRVSGRPLVGSTLTVADDGSWNASTEIYGALGFSYQWLRCGYDGAGCSSVSGATGSSYTVASADSDHALAVQVTAADSGASASATVSLPAIGGYRSAVFGTGSALRGYWPLDEAYSSPYDQQAADISDSPAAGTYQSGVTLNQGGAVNDGSDHAANFNGSTGYLSTASVSKLQPTASASLEVWFKTSSANLQKIMTAGQGSGLELSLSNGSLRGIVNSVGVVSARSSYNDGAWHYAAVTWDGSKVSLYADGALAVPATYYSNPSTQTSAPSYGSTGVYIGISYGLGGYFNGSLDEAALYGSNSDSSGALTAGQVAQRYQAASMLAAPPSWSAGGSNAAVPGLCNCAQGAADPVNTANGDFSDIWTDVSLNSYGPAVAFSRTYDASLAQAQASAGTPGVVGYGWTDNWDTSLSIGSGVVTATQPNAAQVSFYPPVGGACQAPYVGPGTTGSYCASPDVTASLSYNSSSSTYTLIAHPSQSYTFNSSGQLTGQAGPGGAALTVSYNTPSPGSGSCPSTASNCTTIGSASGRALVIAKNSSAEITKVVDPLGRAWTYAYCSPPSSTCSTGDLVSVTDPLSRVTSFTYDATNSNSSLQHDLLTITKPNGQAGGPDAGAKLANAYNAAGQVVSQTDPNGYQTTFDYSNMNAATGLGYVVVTDPDGNQTRDSYYNGVLVSEVAGYESSSSSTTSYGPDPSTLLDTTITDPNGTSSYSYDTNGIVTSSTNPIGQTATYSYNSFDEQTCAATAMAASPCSSLSPPTPITAGAPTISPPSSTPPAYVTFNEYDTNGNVIWTTAGAYDPGSSSASQVRTTYNLYTGESVTISGANDSCTASAPASALPCATIDGNGVVTQLGYDSAGDLTSSATPDGNSGGEIAKTTYGYDSDGEPTSVTAPDGNLAGATAANFTTTTAYDNDGEVATVTVGHTGGGLTARATSYGYDSDANRTSVT